MHITKIGYIKNNTTIILSVCIEENDVITIINLQEMLSEYFKNIYHSNLDITITSFCEKLKVEESTGIYFAIEATLNTTTMSNISQIMGSFDIIF